MFDINISHKKIPVGVVSEFSSAFDNMSSVQNLLQDDGYWCTRKCNSLHYEYVSIDFKKIVPINYIEIFASPSGKTTFPYDFRFERSNDGLNWTIIHTEKQFELDESDHYIIHLPVMFFRFLKLLIIKPRRIGTKYFSEIRKIVAGIAGIDGISSSSFSSDEHDPWKLLDKRSDTSWNSGLNSESSKEFINIDLGNIFLLNGITLTSTNKTIHGFPENFQIKVSTDRSIWTTIFEERNFDAEISQRYKWVIHPTPARYIHIETYGVKLENGNFGVRLSEIEILATSINNGSTNNINEVIPYASAFQAGIVKLAKDGEVSSASVIKGNDSRLRDASTIFKGIVQLAENGDVRENYVVQSSDSRLKSATEFKSGIVRFAKDGEAKAGVVVQGNDSRLRKATEQNYGIVKMCPDGVSSEFGLVKGNDIRLNKATTERYGICRLAANGSNIQNCVVQGDDKRLRDATTAYKGIVELAEDGEEIAGVVVQGNDKRLKEATVISKGIVELAENGEDRVGVVVQGNDKRLREATTVSKGIVELAEDGEDRPGVVVQSNDVRLKSANTKKKGIMRFAEDCETLALTAVQGSDKRLRESTTVFKGIVELAEDGEDRAGVVVQGNDKRLREATTVSKGIVELAEDGEEIAGVAVQGNDKRLRDATEDRIGIVRFAKNGEQRTGFAVQANDNRLSDKRMPLKHSHDYAPSVHEFNRHAGTIKIIDSKEEKIEGVVPPTDNSAIIYAKNESEFPGASGIVGISSSFKKDSKNNYGIIGHSKFVGVRGQSTGNNEVMPKGCGVLGISRFGSGGVFASEHSYSLVVDGYGSISQYDDSINLMGNGEALSVNGKSEFKGKIFIRNSNKDNNLPLNVVEMYEVEETQYIMPGDLVVVSENGKSILSRSMSSYNRSIIGVISANPAVIINPKGDEKNLYPVVIVGRALCRVIAREKPVKPGDLIVSSNTPGCGMVGEIDSFSKIGSVIGKALDGLDDGIDVIPIFISHS